MFCNNVRMVQLGENIVRVVQKSSAFQGSRYQLSEVITFKVSGKHILYAFLRVYGCLVAKSPCKAYENIT